MERTRDPLDAAAELTENLNRAAEEHVRLKARPEQIKDAQGNWHTTSCIDCEEDIELPRLEMGRVRCFSCQDLLEKRNRPYART
jgi:RNA polymerase-binding transcription factor DksA